jgi:hypothetical protein
LATRLAPEELLPMDYREADERVFKITQADATPMFSGVARTAFPHSYRAMFGFYAKTNLLKTALFDMVEAENPTPLRSYSGVSANTT